MTANVLLKVLSDAPPPRTPIPLFALPLVFVNHAAVACSFSPEALTSLASFTESLSLCLGFLARANRLTAQTVSGNDASVQGRRVSQGRRSASRGTSSAGGRRRTMGGGGEGTAGAWNVAFDFRKMDALLTMLKQLDDQGSAGHLMNAGNQVCRCGERPEGGWGADCCPRHCCFEGGKWMTCLLQVVC